MSDTSSDTGPKGGGGERYARVRIPDQLYEELAAAAERNKHSVNAEMLQRLSASLGYDVDARAFSPSTLMAMRFLGATVQMVEDRNGGKPWLQDRRVRIETLNALHYVLGGMAAWGRYRPHDLDAFDPEDDSADAEAGRLVARAVVAFCAKDRAERDAFQIGFESKPDHR